MIENKKKYIKRKSRKENSTKNQAKNEETDYLVQVLQNVCRLINNIFDVHGYQKLIIKLKRERKTQN